MTTEPPQPATDDLDHWASRWATQLVASSPRRAAEHGHRYPPDLAAAVEAALDQAERCRVCGRRLTDPESIARKIGPDCLGRTDERGAT